MRINLKFFIVIFCGIYVCQAMEEAKSSPHIQRHTHDPVGFDSSNFVHEIDEILIKVIENNKKMVSSEKLLETEKASINQENKWLLLAIELSQGKEYVFAQDIVPDSEGRVGYYPLTTLIDTLFEFGMTLEKFNLHGKISKEQYEQHLLYLSKLGMIRHKVSFIEKLQNASEEKPRGSSKKSSNEKCLIH